VTSTDEQFLQKAMDVLKENMGDCEFDVDAFAGMMPMSRSWLYMTEHRLSKLNIDIHKVMTYSCDNRVMCSKIHPWIITGIIFMMKKLSSILLFTSLLATSFGQNRVHQNANKQSVITIVDKRFNELIDLSDRIWSYAEIAFRESRSSRDLSAFAQANGFKVSRGVGEIPTAFVAEYGSGHPVIGILGEFDALPGLSQKTVPHKDPLHKGSPGHGCGHNLFGVASLGAATAIKELIETGELKGTIRFYGAPAEEKFFGKLWMIRAGLFDDVDVVVDWHPGGETKAAVQSSLAMVDFLVEFYGQAAHASVDPWNGRDASDALEQNAYQLSVTFLER
jgi:aminobenzoyl-glutamate utilization protein B